MAKLVYNTESQKWIPGWPASDHEDDDEERVKAKLDSGLYTLAKGRKAREEPETAEPEETD